MSGFLTAGYGVRGIWIGLGRTRSQRNLDRPGFLTAG